MGAINWIRLLLGLTNVDLHSLFDILRGDPSLTSPRVLTETVKQDLHRVANAISERQASRCVPGHPYQLILFNPSGQPYALLFQWDETLSDPLVIIEWIFLSHQMHKTVTTHPETFAKLIMKGRHCLLLLAGQEPVCIIVLVTMHMLQWLIQMSLEFQTAICDYPGQLLVHSPSHKLLQQNFLLYAMPKCSHVPLQALTVFTDGSGKMGKSVIVWQDPHT